LGFAVDHLLLVDEVLALDVDGDLQGFLRQLGRLARRLRQVHPQLRLVFEGGRYHEEDEQQEDDVDQRRQIELDVVPAVRAEVHALSSLLASCSRSPCITSTILVASCSMRTTSMSTLPRK